MYKVMIVDDEQIVRDGISFIIESAFDEVEVVALARSGRAAIELFEEKRPDIILMDIQMPGINGIEAIRSIREVDSKVRFIIISAFEQFEYAKSAVMLGVKEYILKPINRQKLTEAINKIIREIDRERRNKQREIEIQEKLDQVRPVLEHGYIYSIIMNCDYEKENEKYKRLLDIKADASYMMVIEFGDEKSPREASNRIGTGVRGDQVYKSIRNMIKYKSKAIVGPMIVNRIPVMVLEGKGENDYQKRVAAVTLAEQLHERISELTDTEVYIGIGSSCQLHRMNVSYNEAIKALGKMTDETVLHIKDAVKDSQRSYSYLKMKSDEDAILKRVEEGNTRVVKEKLELFLTKLHKSHMDDMAAIYGIVTELMVLIFTAGYRSDSLSKSQRTSEYLDKINSFEDFGQLQYWCITTAVAITEAIGQEKSFRVSGVISEAMAYIQKEYCRDLRLSDVAEAVAISPQYFSKIFKKELGVNFIDYLTKIRIEAAKQMLLEGHMSIKEICFAIGYNDPNYFSRLFKKVEGISPTEYVQIVEVKK